MRRQELKMKDIDLLRSYQKNDEAKEVSPWLKYAIAPVSLCIVIGVTFGYFAYQNHQLGQEIDRANAEIMKLQEASANDPNASKYMTLTEKRSKIALYASLYEKIISYPTLQQGTFDAIANSAYGTSNITSLNYARESQVITLQIETDRVNGTEDFVRRLKGSEVFQDVTYSGYSQTKKQNEAAPQLTPEQIQQYLAQGITPEVTNNTYTVYTATVQCVLK